LPFDTDFVDRQLRDRPGYRLTFELSSPLPDGQPQADGPPSPPNAVLVLDRATAQNADDLRAIVEMNIREYGRGPAVLPLDNPKLLSRFVSRLLLITLIEWSMRCKLLRTADHVIYVAKFIDPTRSHRRLDKSNNNNNNNSSRNADYQYVGMIEVSLQPVLRQRNPPPFPIPLSVKRWIAQAHGVPIQGWISNLLVVPECRGAGYSKLLVRAAEAVAQREWGCDSIHLHCDADPVGGSIARELYATLGYEVLPNQQSYVSIDGVSLLYLSKSMST
jgi:GNAT superfamily N-acetyltransferase